MSEGKHASIIKILIGILESTQCSLRVEEKAAE